MDGNFKLNRILVAVLLVAVCAALVPEMPVHAASSIGIDAVSCEGISAVYGLSILKNVAEFLTRIVEIASFLVNAVITIVDILPRLLHLFLPFFPITLCRVVSYFIYFLLIKGLIDIIRG